MLSLESRAYISPLNAYDVLASAQGCVIQTVDTLAALLPATSTGPPHATAMWVYNMKKQEVVGISGTGFDCNEFRGPGPGGW